MPEQQATQKFVEIETVKDGVIILKNGKLRQILMVSGINFDLKSEDEQNLITTTYQNFLNSLDFSMQFIIHSRRLNIENYLNKLKARRDQETNELLKAQTDDYIEFIRSYLEANAIMDKTFFVVVPYDPIILPKAVKSGWFPFMSKKIKEQAPSVDQGVTANLQQINQRVDQIIVGLNQIGLRAIPLNEEETTELLYNLYNPESVEKKGITLGKNK